MDAVEDASVLERLTEIAVIISLFTAGLKLRLPGSDQRWRAPILLAALAMVLTIGGIAGFAMAALGLSVGAAVLLGALLAPTDPVLASDVQVSHEHDAEPVRFSLTGEAGLNDGTAFPFVMLGLGLMGTHGIGAYGWRWLTVDLVWAVAAGLGVGTLCGAGIGKLVLYLRRVHREAVGLDEFLALGLIALSYGIALLVHAYGFLAVFAAGLSVRRIERQQSEVAAPPDVEHAGTSTEEQATHPNTAPAYMARAVLGFNEQLERLGELAVVLVVGAMLADIQVVGPGIWLALEPVCGHSTGGDAAHAVPRTPVKTTASVHCMVRRARDWLDLLSGLRVVSWRTRAGRSDARGCHAGRGRRVDCPARHLGDPANAAVFSVHWGASTAMSLPRV